MRRGLDRLPVLIEQFVQRQVEGLFPDLQHVRRLPAEKAVPL